MVDVGFLPQNTGHSYEFHSKNTVCNYLKCLSTLSRTVTSRSLYKDIAICMSSISSAKSTAINILHTTFSYSKTKAGLLAI